MMPSLLFPVDLFFCVFFLFATPVLVFVLITFNKEKNVRLRMQEESVGALVRLWLSIVLAGVAGFFMLRAYLVLSLIILFADAESGMAERGGLCSIEWYFIGGLLFYAAVSVLVSVVPVLAARCMGFRMAPWVWIGLPVAAIVPYVAYVGMEVMKGLV